MVVQLRFLHSNVVFCKKHHPGAEYGIELRVWGKKCVIYGSAGRVKGEVHG